MLQEKVDTLLFNWLYFLLTLAQLLHVIKHNLRGKTGERKQKWRYNETPWRNLAFLSSSFSCYGFHLRGMHLECWGVFFALILWKWLILQPSGSLPHMKQVAAVEIFGACQSTSGCKYVPPMCSIESTHPCRALLSFSGEEQGKSSTKNDSGSWG